MRLALSALALIAALALPTAASASWYLSHADAVYGAEDTVDTVYSFTQIDDLQVSCRPYYATRERRGNRWHRWTCVWSGTDNEFVGDVGGKARYCGGTYRIRGSKTEQYEFAGPLQRDHCRS
jgi:hypothetical protein